MDLGAQFHVNALNGTTILTLSGEGGGVSQDEILPLQSGGSIMVLCYNIKLNIKFSAFIELDTSFKN